MRILIDIRKLGDGGIGVYIENLIDGLLASSDDLELSLLVDPRIVHEKVAPLFGEYSGVISRWKERAELISEKAPKYSLSEYFGIGRRHRRLISQLDLYHSPHYTLPFHLGVPSIVTIHDVIHINRPEHWLHRPLATTLIRSAMTRARAVITVSATSKEQLRALSPQQDHKVHVVPNAVRRGLGFAEKAELSEYRQRKMLQSSPMILFVGSDRPHKGLDILLDAFSQFRSEFSGATLLLVGERYGPRTRSLLHQHGLEPHVRLLGSVRTAELGMLYQLSDLVAVPSREEGFGLVALEALSCGRSVVCSPALSLREVCRDAAWYAEDHSAQSFYQALYTAWMEKDKGLEKIRKGKLRAQNFSREAIAAETLEIYERAVGAAPSSSAAVSGK